MSIRDSLRLWYWRAVELLGVIRRRSDIIISSALIGLLVAIPSLVGLAAMILVSRSSDRRLERRYHAAIPLAVGGLALILLGATKSPLLSIVLWSVVAMGVYSFFGPFFSMPSRFLAGFSAASGIALINCVGNLGGFAGPSAIGALAGGSRGIYEGLAFAGVSLFGSAALVLLLPGKIRQEKSRQEKSPAMESRHSVAEPTDNR